MPEHKVFFALQPDDAAAEQVMRVATDLRRRHGLAGRVTAPARLNLSLNFVGTFRGPPTKAVMEKAMGIAATVVTPPFRVTLNRVESWNGSPRSLVLLGDEGVIAAQMLHSALHKALAAKSMAPRREPAMQPHITLLWDKAESPPERVGPVSWTVQEFVLLDSVEGEGRHEVLGRWALGL